MSWVSTNKLTQLANSLRNKFTTNELVLANSDKSKGAYLNVGGQDGLITVSPMVEDGSTPAALWVTDSAANNATELTGGTLSYVTDVGADTEDYTSLSLVGGVVNVSGKNGAQRRITNVATPISDNDAVNLQYIKNGGAINFHYEKSREKHVFPEKRGVSITYGNIGLISQNYYIVSIGISIFVESSATLSISFGYMDEALPGVQYCNIDSYRLQCPEAGTTSTIITSLEKVPNYTLPTIGIYNMSRAFTTNEYAAISLNMIGFTSK